MKFLKFALFATALIASSAVGEEIKCSRVKGYSDSITIEKLNGKEVRLSPGFYSRDLCDNGFKTFSANAYSVNHKYAWVVNSKDPRHPRLFYGTNCRDSATSDFGYKCEAIEEIKDIFYEKLYDMKIHEYEF